MSFKTFPALPTQSTLRRLAASSQPSPPLLARPDRLQSQSWVLGALEESIKEASGEVVEVEVEEEVVAAVEVKEKDLEKEVNVEKVVIEKEEEEEDMVEETLPPSLPLLPPCVPSAVVVQARCKQAGGPLWHRTVTKWDSYRSISLVQWRRRNRRAKERNEAVVVVVVVVWGGVGGKGLFVCVGGVEAMRKAPPETPTLTRTSPLHVSPTTPLPSSPSTLPTNTSPLPRPGHLKLV
ncbi:hypothetical protein O3P69_000734 [Scylla paramamosain]|uniref:Uncharacterized protein n=1 Tax=Scylla paramamosain TaxID=85552 RepID=A0AAW0UQT7_SCYPA